MRFNQNFRNSLTTKIKFSIFIALSSPCFATASESVQLQLRWHHQFQFAGYYAALEKGYYKKAGLDVIIPKGTPEKMPVKEVLQGHAQSGVDFYSDILFATEDEIRHHSERVKAFRQARLEGWYYALNHTQEIFDLFPNTGIAKEKLVKYLKVTVVIAIVISFIALILYTAYRSMKRENSRRIAIEKELRNRTRELALHNQILEKINQGIELPALLDELARQIEALHPGMVCSILLLDTEGKHLYLGAAPSLPDFYHQAINGLTIGDGAGGCGTAAYLNERVIIEDMQQHPYCESFRELARLAGIESCWSQPIRNSKGEVLGTFGIHHKKPARPTNAEIALIENYANLAQLGIEHKLADSALLESEERLRFVLEGSGLGFWDWKLDTNKVERDPVWAAIIGYSHEEIKHTTREWTDFIYPDDRDKAWQSINDVLEGRSSTHKIEYRMIHKNGSLRWILDHAKVVQQDQDGRPIRISGTHADITERKIAEAELRIAAAAFESQEGIVVTNADNVIVKVNQAFSKVSGYTAKEAVGHTPQDLLRSGRQDAAFYTAMWDSIRKTGAWQGEIWNRRKNGEVYPEWRTITVVKGIDGETTHYVAMLTDITERKAAEEKIKQLAFYDPLTQLPNRRLLLERLKHCMGVERREGKQLALLMLDLDRFKAVNDTLGHLSGDELLQQVAKRITARLREVDLVARLGGDEFIVLLKDITHPENAARIAENVVADLSKPFRLSRSDDVRVGASIGISLYPQHGNSPEALMTSADAALYQAKNQGRGCYAYFSEELTLAARERIALETRLRQAIDQQEFRVFYQPLIDIANGCIVGAEALLRWQSPNEGLIFPGHFIPLAEETNLISVIGAWVLRETCRQGQQWLNEGLPALTLSVNVSPHQFRRQDINALVASVLRETGYPAGFLALEITESGLMENQDKAMAILNDLRAQGIRLAIDDFGTGYSSLAYLKSFPLDVLKIDKNFIDDIPFLQGNMEITATIIAMAHILGFKVSAEGVETAEQLAFLQVKGCDSYQGYLSSQALPAEAFAELYRKSRFHYS